MAKPDTLVDDLVKDQSYHDAQESSPKAEDNTLGTEQVYDLKSDSLLEIAQGQDVLTLTQEELERFDRRPLNIDGFRLERVDVYNWGSFNNNVKSVYFGGQNVLMTGDNGAGKSSIIDAITVLLYDVKKITFNQAAGAEKGERNLASYVLGLYKNDNSSGVKTELGLRSKDQAVLTIIMASFYNKKLNEHVVLIQCLVMMKPKTSPSRYYFIANKDFNLQQDILPVKDARELGVKLREIGATRFEQFGEYYSHMQRLFGIENTKVLDLFYKTISMKSISNISDFVRKQMLEDFNGDELVEQLVDRFNDLDASYKSVEEAKKQVEALEPICKMGEEYQSLKAKIRYLSDCETGAPLYLYKKKADFLNLEIKSNQDNIALLNNDIQQVTKELEQIDQQIISTKTELEQQGGHRLELLNNELKGLEEKRITVKKTYDKFIGLLNQAGLEPIESKQAFNNLNQKLSKQKENLEQQVNSFEDNVSQRVVEQNNLEKSISKIDDELHSLSSRKSNIPADYINARSKIVNHIGCKESDLPFAGELMQVKAEEKHRWENAIEKVLRSFAISMLVPEQYYKDVTDYVNKNNVGVRLVFFRIKENDFHNNNINTSLGAQFSNQLNSFGRRSSLDTLPKKIEIKNDPVFHSYLRQHLERSYNYVCTDDLNEYRQERMALTSSGMSKNGGRNEKDDRKNQRNNDYVLGWTNEEKIALLKNELKNLNVDLTTVKNAIKNLRQGRSTLNNQLMCIKTLNDYQLYEQIDYRSVDEAIVKKQAEISELERTNDIFRTLQKRLEQYEEDRKFLNDRKNNSHNQLGQLQARNEDYNKERQNAEDLSEGFKYLTDAVIDSIERLIDDALDRLHYSALDLDHIDVVLSELLSRLKQDIVKLKANESNTAQELVNMQSRFCQNFVVAARNLDASRADAWEDFRAFLDKLMTDDLPRFVDAFKDKLNRETIDQLGTLNAALNTHCRKIKERIADINVIMKDVDFNVDRYIQMEARENPDVEIKQFRADLRNCTSTSNADGSLENAESRFYQVKALIDRFKGEVNGSEIDRRWRNKVTDVKQWFDFAASEHSRIDDSQTDYYEDSGGKSGGQKEKLAYTVLASSIAYQYRSKARQKGGLSVNSALDNGLSVDEAMGEQNAFYSYADRSYRFVVIDEAFGRGSPQSVDYALTLFSKFNLQLLIATPMQKLDIIEKYVNHVAFVYRDEDTHESTVVNYELDDYIIKRKLKEQIARAPFMSANAMSQAQGINALSAQEANELYNQLDERILNEQNKFAGPSVTNMLNEQEQAQAIIKKSASTQQADEVESQDKLVLGSLFSDDELPAVEAEPKANKLQLQDAEGNYLDTAEYAAKIHEQRKLSEQQRTEKALSKLDFLESLHQDEPQDHDVILGVVSDVEVSEPKPKKHKEVDEEPKYSHSLEELLIIEDEDDTDQV